MSWNYRYCKTLKDDILTIYLRECYYDKKGNVTSWSRCPVNIVELLKETEPNEMSWLVTNLNLAAKKPVVILNDK